MPSPPPRLPPPATSASSSFVATVLLLLTVASSVASGGGYDYPTCDSCHCIAGGSVTCPVDDKPQTVWPSETLHRYKNMTYLNPLELPCDPYTNGACETVPPRTLVEFGDDAVCGIKYHGSPLSSTTTGGCPESYEAISYESICEMENDGAVLTHWGACGTCSSLRDLASFIEVPDLVDISTYCFFNEYDTFDSFVQCYMDRAGFSKPCATQFARDSDQTRSKCLPECSSKYAQNRPNNGPPPSCDLDPCLVCNDDNNGVIFAQFAGRTRRRANLLSAIVRPCGDLLPVEHLDPCNVTAMGGGNETCSEAPSARPSMEPSETGPSEVPSVAPSEVPSTSALPSAGPTVWEPSENPSAGPSVGRPAPAGPPTPTSGGSSIPTRTTASTTAEFVLRTGVFAAATALTAISF